MIELTQALCKAARGLMEWTAMDLAGASGISIDTLRSFESGRTQRLGRDNEALVIRAFEERGVEFIPENGGGAGVRLRDRSKPDTM